MSLAGGIMDGVGSTIGLLFSILKWGSLIAIILIGLAILIYSFNSIRQTFKAKKKREDFQEELEEIYN